MILARRACIAATACLAASLVFGATVPSRAADDNSVDAIKNAVSYADCDCLSVGVPVPRRDATTAESTATVVAPATCEMSDRSADACAT